MWQNYYFLSLITLNIYLGLHWVSTWWKWRLLDAAENLQIYLE
jgi:hypothetical protein